MSIKKTIGGDRLGAGNKMQVRLHNYERSTQNLGRTWRSSMTPGTLIPSFVELALNGDTFDIDIASKIRTIPTTGPLFGSFKFQTDLFICPIRLYQGLLHNNAVKIGMEMGKVYLPKIQTTFPVRANQSGDPAIKEENLKAVKFNPSSLMRYLGIAGIGSPADGTTAGSKLYRDFNAIPLIAYWDIFKNYYANKQENNAYYITQKTPQTENHQRYIYRAAFGKGHFGYPGQDSGNTDNWTSGLNIVYPGKQGITPTGTPTPTWNLNENGLSEGVYAPLSTDFSFLIRDTRAKGNKDKVDLSSFYVQLYRNTGGNAKPGTPPTLVKFGINELFYTGYEINHLTGDDFIVKGKLGSAMNMPSYCLFLFDQSSSVDYSIGVATIHIDAAPQEVLPTETDLAIQEFPLENLDKMRQHILKMCGLGDKVTITSNVAEGTTDIATGNINIKPYNACSAYNADYSYNCYPLNGVAVKTYQSDIFNNWLNTEWISGDNGIAAITAVSTADGSFTMDALNLAQKVYNMLNRVAVSGGTYEDWQEAVYGQDAIRRAESPIYIGGMSMEIVFDEVISTAETETSNGNSALGALGGRGVAVNKKGGHIKVKVNEPSFIIGISSITPRIDYYQGNKWWTYSLDSIDDLHKPALDGIGFQELIEEQMLFSTTEVLPNGNITQKSAGKQPAWLNYMTAYNEVFGEFADENKAMYMVLTRRYEGTDEIEDLTTYIDPTKFNYAFSDLSIEAQFFWVQLGFDVKARRKMSAKMIPNL